MTCFDMYITEQKLPVVGCPVDYGYMQDRPADCYCISCFKDCWAREAIVNNKKEESEKV